jgi:tetratricopeptide (TPR) repeat protein
MILAAGGLFVGTPPLASRSLIVRTASKPPGQRITRLTERAYLRQVQEELHRGDSALAVKTLARATTDYPRSAALRYVEAGILVQMREYPRARRLYEAVVRLAPDQPSGYFGLAQVTFAQRDYPASGAALRAVLRLDPRSAVAYAKLGRVYTEAFDTPRALAALRKAVALDPQSEEAQFYIGDLLLRTSRLDEAQPYLERAVTMAPRNAIFQSALGNLFLERRQSPENTARALAAYQTAARLDPQLAAAHYGLGRLYARQRRWHEADQELRTTLRLDPAFGRAHYTMAQVCRHLGQPTQAAQHLAAFRQYRSGSSAQSSGSVHK